jgi:hypothetical protein
MLGLAMVAAIAAMAFIGAGTASATLCKVNQSPCVAANQYPTPSEVLVESKGVKLSGSLTVSCESEGTLKHEATSGKKLTGTFTKLVWTNCTGCTKVTTTNLGTFDDEATGSGNGTLLPLNVTVLLQGCPLGLDCTATSTNGTTLLGLDGGTIGGTAAGLASTTVGLSGGLCGSTGTWTTGATTPYVVTAVNGSKTGSLFLE